MPDYGTVGNVLDRLRKDNPNASPPVDPPADKAPDPPAATKPDDAPPDKPDNSGVENAVGDHKRRLEQLAGRMEMDDVRAASLQPPSVQPAPKQPEVQDTPPAERWGSAAMFLAGLGSLLTRAPLTTALNSMADVNHAFNERDAAKAKTAYDAWKIQSENAIKLSEFQNKAYENALKRIDTDRKGAVSEAQILARSFKDDVVTQLFESGQTDAALGVLGARPRQTQTMAEHAEKVNDQHAAIDYWDQSHPDATPQQRALAHGAIRANKDPDAMPGGPAGAAERDVDTVANDEIAKQEAARGSALTDAEKAQVRLNARNQNRQEQRAPTPQAQKEKDVETLATEAFRTKFGRDPTASDAAAMANMRTEARKHTDAQGARAAQLAQRTLTSASDAVTDISNVVELPITLSTGIFGGRHQGPSLMDATKEVLANKVTGEEVQAYNTALAGISRAMGGLATGGLAVSDEVMRSFNGLEIKEGDTNFTKLRKIATMRQNVENAIDSALSGSTLTDAQRKQAEDLRTKLIKSVPYSVHDVNEVEFGKNKSAKVSDYAKKVGVDKSGDFPNAPAVGAVQDGHRYKGGDPSKEASWEAVSG